MNVNLCRLFIDYVKIFLSPKCVYFFVLITTAKDNSLFII